MEQQFFWQQDNCYQNNNHVNLNLIREKMAVYGTGELDLFQILAMITGARQEKALMKLSMLGIRELSKMSINEMGEHGLSKTAASKLVASFALADKLLKEKPGKELFIKHPVDVFELLNKEIGYLEQEHFKVILLNTKNKVIGIKTVTIGTLDTCLVHPRETFKEAIRKSAAAIIAIHNHPSGDPQPSSQDLKIANRLKEAGEVLGIDLLDFIIIGKEKYVSLKERGNL